MIFFSSNTNWVDILALAFSAISLLISIVVALMAHIYHDKEFKLNKRKEFYEKVNIFLLMLEYEVTYKNNNFNSKYDDKTLDSTCLETIAFINTFCQIHLIDQKITQVLRDNLILTSNEVQRNRNEGNNEIILDEIRTLRGLLCDLIIKKEFINIK